MKKTRTAKKGSSAEPGARAKASSVEQPILAVVDAAAWADWLSSHHDASRGVWLKLAKKGGGERSPTYAEALEVSLAWGWIDGQKRPLDETWWLQKFTPRGPRSLWSKINCAKAEALIASGAMRPPGLAAIERARADGRWARAYASQSRADVPPDLASALAASPRAARFFATLDSRNRYAVLFRVHEAKKPETRAARIAKFVEMLAREEKLHP